MNTKGRVRRAAIPGLLSLFLVAACGSEEGGGEADSASAPHVGETMVDERGTGVVPREPLENGEQSPSDLPGVKNGATQSRRPDSINARDLLEELQSLSREDQDRAREQSQNLLQRLREQGGDALIPIRDLLLDGTADGLTPELRQALLDVLLGLGVPEVEEVALELLASKPSAVETWQLGRYLESANPGKYTDSIRTAAEHALIETAPSVTLPGEFFLFLAEMGNEETALLLAELPMHQEAYGTLALTAIPEGAGVPLLAQDARAFEAGRDTVQGRLALQLLAQEAPRSPEAAAVLIDLAEQGVIPQDLWPYVLDIVAGNWTLTLIEPPPGDVIGSHTYYHPEGDQVIYRAVRHQDQIEDGLQSQRLFLLDRLQPLAPQGLWPGTNG